MTIESLTSQKVRRWNLQWSHADGSVTPIDALVIVNDLNARSARRLQFPEGGRFPPPYIDVSGDNFAAPGDVLVLVNFLNSLASEGQGESAAASPGNTPGAAIQWVVDNDDDFEELLDVLGRDRRRRSLFSSQIP